MAKHCDYCEKGFNGAFIYTNVLDGRTYCSKKCAESADKCFDGISPDVTDLIANLARRVSSLEQQLADVQRNIERMGYELANNTKELDDKVEMVIGDIIMLDERTQPQHADVVTFEKFLDSVAEKVAERLVRQ